MRFVLRQSSTRHHVSAQASLATLQNKKTKPGIKLILIKKIFGADRCIN